MEQLRHRTLLKEFQQYVETKGKLKVVRAEACEQDSRNAGRTRITTIVQMAKRVPETVIQGGNPALLMYYDNAINAHWRMNHD